MFREKNDMTTMTMTFDLEGKEVDTFLNNDKTVTSLRCGPFTEICFRLFAILSSI